MGKELQIHYCYIDCYDGRHPNTLVPSPGAANPTSSRIEDINNYLLQHKEVIDFVKKRAAGGARQPS